MSARYWLVKATEGSVAETVCKMLRGSEFDGVEVVEVIPEDRTSNWMERALAADLAKKLDGDNRG